MGFLTLKYYSVVLPTLAAHHEVQANITQISSSFFFFFLPLVKEEKKK